MPETQPKDMTAADIRRLLWDKFPPRTDGSGKPIIDREYILAGIVLAIAEQNEKQEKALREVGAVVAFLSQALEIDLPQLVLAIRSGQVPSFETETTETEEVVGGEGGAGPGGAAGAGGGAAGGGGGGAVASSPSAPSDKTPFPAGASPNIKPGDPAQKVTVQSGKKTATAATPTAATGAAAAAASPIATNLNTSDEVDGSGIPKPNVQSGPPTNAAPIPVGKSAPNPNGAKA